MASLGVATASWFAVEGEIETSAPTTRDARPLRTIAAPSKARRTNSEFFMDAILTILAFLVVFGGLNYFEFGRLD
jgi:hypothetical protein